MKFASLLTTVFLIIQGSFVYGEQLYSIETDNDELVVLDSVTGSATTVGALSFDANDVDLTVLNGNLYALNMIGGTGLRLYPLNTNDGSTISSTDIFEGATQITFAEGLGNSNGQLKIGYNRTGIAASNSLGALALNGQVAHLGTGSFDFDAMGIDHSTGNLHGADVVTLAPSTNYYTIGESPVSISNYRTSEPNFSNDLVVNSGTLFSLDHSDSQLQVIDLGTGQSTTTILPSGGTYLGLALAAVPEPSALCLVSVFAAGLVLRRNRILK